MKELFLTVLAVLVTVSSIPLSGCTTPAPYSPQEEAVSAQIQEPEFSGFDYQFNEIGVVLDENELDQIEFITIEEE